MKRVAALIAVAALLFALRGVASEPEQISTSDDILSALQQNVWYFPTADTNARIYVTEIGQGDPVIFLHGGPGNDFNYIVDALRPHVNNNRFILFDQRGSLLSPVKAEDVPSITIDKLVEDLEVLRQSTGQQRLTLFGHSFGTLLALSYYKKYPDHVKKLILTGFFPPYTQDGVSGFIKTMRPRQQALRDRPIEIDRAWESAGLPKDSADDTPQQNTIRWRISNQAPISIIDLTKWKKVTGGMVYYNQDVDEAVGNSLPETIDFRETIGAHPIPIVIIQGDRDYIDPGASQWVQYEQDNPMVRVFVIPASSHYAWIDSPGSFSAAFAQALEAAAP